MIDLRPWGEINTPNRHEANLCVMGIPFDSAVSCGKGSALAPETIRNLSRYLPATTEEGHQFENLKVYDHGDVPMDLNWEKYYSLVESEALDLLSTDKFCLFIGGDHSVSIPLHKAFRKKHEGKKMGIIHFDSHSDICDEYDNHKWSHACTEKRALDDLIEPQDLALVGIRSWEAEEIEYLDENPVLLIKAFDIFKDGYKSACERLRERFKDYDVIYFTLDIDVIDPAFAPGTGTPEAGGPSSREVIEMVKFIFKELPIAAMDVVEVAPPLDTTNQITSWAALKIIYEVFGELSKR